MSIHKITAKVRKQFDLTVEQADELVHLCTDLPAKEFKALMSAVSKGSWEIKSLLHSKTLKPEVAQRLTRHLHNHREHVDVKLAVIAERAAKYQDVLMKLVLKGAKTNHGHSSELVQKFIQQLDALHKTTDEIEKSAQKEIRTASR